MSFILLANMVMLAHSLVPHHHHNGNPVAICVNYHEHNNATDKHRHHADTLPREQSANPDRHCNGIFEDCALSSILVKIGNDKQALQCIDFEFDPSPCLPVFSINPITKTTDLEGLPFRQHPYILQCYTDFVTQSLGLRAPPVC